MADGKTGGGTCVHLWPVRVYYEDTDASGVVYHASYLRFAERARTELIRTFGIESSRFLAGEEGPPVLFQVHRLEMDCLGVARLDDVIVVHTHLAAVGGASFTFAHTLIRGESVVARGKVLVACVRRDTGRPTRLPAMLRNRFKPYINRD